MSVPRLFREVYIVLVCTIPTCFARSSALVVIFFWAKQTYFRHVLMEIMTKLSQNHRLLFGSCAAMAFSGCGKGGLAGLNQNEANNNTPGSNVPANASVTRIEVSPAVLEPLVRA